MARILLVEDSPTQAAMVQRLLQASGHDVVLRCDGQQALDHLASESVDLVITDLMMPHVDGSELTRQVVANTPHIPVVVITAHGAEGPAVDALADGAVNFVPKTLLNARLPLVVCTLWERIRIDRQTAKSGISLLVPELVFELDNDMRSIWQIANYVQQTLAMANAVNTNSRFRFVTAVASGLINAICYGNLDLRDSESAVIEFMRGDFVPKVVEHKVRLVISVGVEDSRVSISHDGPGVMTRTSPAPGTPESFDLEDCRGMLLMTSFMDQVIFNQTRNEVVMLKKHQK